jgi:hypothetical protein
MPANEDKAAHDALDRLRVVEQYLRRIAQLSHGPNSCDHKLVASYTMNALSHLQAARRRLGATEVNEE